MRVEINQMKQVEHYCVVIFLWILAFDSFTLVDKLVNCYSALNCIYIYFLEGSLRQ